MENQKTYKLFLDDIRNPRDAFNYTGFVPFNTERWIIVRNYDQFTDYITRNYKNGYFPNFIAFDHDLADEHYAPQEHWDEKYDEWTLKKQFKEKTGMDCAKWLVEFCMDNKLKLPEFICHSMNPAGAKNIISLLENYVKHEKKLGL